MLILSVDTSSKEFSVAVLRDNEVIAGACGASDEPYASRLFADVGCVIGQAGLELAQIELFAVATGPGSFTGLRVGLTAVKGWSEVFGRPVAPVSALEAVAVQGQMGSGLIAAIQDARGGHIFGGLFRRGDSDGRLRLIGEEVVLSSGEYFGWLAQQSGGEVPLFVTTTPEVARAGLAASAYAGARLEEASRDLAPFIGRLGLARSQRGELVDAASLEANYVRRSDAEVKWRG